MRRVLLALWILIFFGSCQNSNPVNEKIFIDLSDRIERSEDLSPEIKRIEFFQIDDSTPIDKIDNINLIEDRIIFMHRGGRYSSKVNGIVAVDKSGKILWNFDKKGKGPGEFEYMSFVRYLPVRNEIAFFDNRSRKIHFLNPDGKHQGSFSFKENCDNLLELPNGQLVVNLGKQSHMPGQMLSIQHDIVFINDEGLVTERFLQNTDNGIGWFWYGETLLPGVRQFIYTNTLQYTIFTITEEGVDSTWNLDFGEYNADTARYLHPKVKEDYPFEIPTNEVLSIRLVHTERQLWVLVPRMNLQLELAVINKKDHSIKYYQKPKKRDFIFRGIPIPMFQLTQNGDCFVYDISAIDALEKWEKLTTVEKESSNPEWRKLMENLDPESNPIICMLYGK